MDTKISNLTDYTTPLNADYIPVVDTANTTTKKTSWSNIKATLKTYFDTLYTGTVSSVATGTGLTGGAITTTGTISLSTPLQPIATLTGNGTKFLRVNAGETAVEYATVSGGGDALTTNPLSQFAATTSLQLKGVISDETGSGALVFADTPTLVTPILGTPTSGTLTNCTGLPVAGITSSTSTALGVGSLEIGHASDTTLSRASAGVAAIEGNNIVVNTSSPTLGTITTTGNIELGNASDTTLSRSAAGELSVEGVAVLTTSNTKTVTGKRYQPRVYSAANNTSLTPEIDTYDIFHLTAMSGNTTINNHSTSTPSDGEIMEFRFLDNGTARTLTWGTAYVAKAGASLPSTTVLGKNLLCIFEYNSNLAKWNLAHSGQEA